MRRKRNLKISLEKVEKDVALLEEEIKEDEVIVTLEESESEFLVSSVISKEKIDSSLYQIITPKFKCYQTGDWIYSNEY